VFGNHFQHHVIDIDATIGASLTMFEGHVSACASVGRETYYVLSPGGGERDALQFLIAGGVLGIRHDSHAERDACRAGSGVKVSPASIGRQICGKGRSDQDEGILVIRAVIHISAVGRIVV